VAYCAQSDVQLAVGGSEKLLELTDQENTGLVNAGVVTAAIAEADALIDSYAQNRRLVPFNPVPPMIKATSADEAGYVLKKWRGVITQDDQTQREGRLLWLRDLANGIATPGVDPVPTPGSSVLSEVGDRLDDELSSGLKGYA
jgi:phage gp36-like protein